MQKQDITNPLQRDKLDNQPAKPSVMKEADSSVLKTRKILKLKPFGSKESSNDKPTKGIFSLSSKGVTQQQMPISGDFTLKPTSSSLDFFKKGIVSAPQKAETSV